MTWDDYVPVLPYVDGRGRLVSLQRMLDADQSDEAVTYPPLAELTDTTDTRRRFASMTLKELRERTQDAGEQLKYLRLGAEGHWSVSRVSASFAAKAGFGGLFSTRNEAFGDVLVADALVGYRCVREHDGSDDASIPLVYGTFWGFSVRLIVKVMGFKSGTQLDLATVAAHAELGHMRAEYSLEGLGGTLTLFSRLLVGLPSIGKFDQSVLNAVSRTSSEVLAAIVSELEDEDCRLLPIRVGVSLDTMPADSISEARAKRFAFLMLRQKATLKHTLDFAHRKGLLSGSPPELPAAAIRDAYRLVMDDELDGAVTDTHVRAAEEWLNV